MRYQLVNINIHTARNQRGNYSWLEAELNRDDDPFANPSQLPRYYLLNEFVVNAYKQFATVNQELTQRYATNPNRKDANGAVLNVLSVTDLSKLPENLSHVSGVVRTTVPLEGIWGAVYTADNPQTGAKAGDFRRGQNGEVTPVRELILYVKKIKDNETGEEMFQEDPALIARRVLERRYKRLDNFQVQQAPQAIGTPGPMPIAPEQQPSLTPQQQLGVQQSAQVQY
jgi:hypothetical protein